MTARVASLRAELRQDSPNMPNPTPRLAWTIDTDERAWRQESVELTDGITSVEIETDESLFVAWPFSPLRPAESRRVQVRIRAHSGAETPWSEPVDVYGAYLGDRGWQARPIGHPSPTQPGQPILLRKSITIKRQVRHARLLWTALGALEVEINGSKVDDSILSPGWTTFPERLIHETTDVTTFLTTGDNVLGVTLAGAWYTEKFGFHRHARRIYGDQPSALLQLEIDYTDGSSETVATDTSWRTTNCGPLVASGIYEGETHDATRELDGWSNAGFDDSQWVPAQLAAIGAPVPVARVSEPVRRTEERPVIDVFRTPSGALLVDFGQNLVGRLRITVNGPRGHRVTLRHAEVLEAKELGVRPLRRALATDHYILAGDGPETWEPRFTFHGFRYAQIDNWPGDLDPADITAVVIHSDMTPTGWFSSSHEDLNRLHDNVIWSMRGNFLAIPTDCPQRDERLGWTGDIQVFAPTASFLYDCNGFLTAWLRNLWVDQQSLDGVAPVVSPDVLSGAGFADPIAAWGDVATILPWVMYQRFGDKAVLAAQYPSMLAWVDTVLAQTNAAGLWADKPQLGDWLDPSAPPDNPGKARTDHDIIATGYLARSLQIVADTAAILGHTADDDTYRRHHDRVAAAFRHTFVTPAGRVMSDAPTAYAITLEFNLVTDPAMRQRLADRLADLVRADGYHIATGFVGTPIITAALASNGHHYAAERLLLETETPSWLSTVRKGATTIWERWDSMLDDGTINPGEMTSFNHYALGAVADWLHTSVAGLAPDTPGYRRLRIAPRPLRSLESAHARHITGYGPAAVTWHRQAESILVHATVPPNTSAVVSLPGHDEFVVGSGDHEWHFTDPRAPIQKPLTLESPASDIIDNESAYRAFLDVVDARDPGLGDAVRRRVTWSSAGKVKWALESAPAETIAALTDVLEKHSRSPEPRQG